MKFSMKSLAVASALVAAGVSAHAVQTVTTITTGAPAVEVLDPFGSGRTASVKLLSAAGDLYFSNGNANPTTLGNPDNPGGAIGALNVGKITLIGTGAISANEQFASDLFGDSIRVLASAGGPVASLGAITADTVDPTQVGKLTVVSTLPGGADQVAPRQSGVATGGTASVNNIRFDLANGAVIADLSGQKLAIGSTTFAPINLTNVTLWTFNPATDIAGPSSIDPNSLLAADPVTALAADGFTNITPVGTNAEGFTIYQGTANTAISNLQITTQGRNFFRDSFGLLTTGLNALDAVNGDVGGWGTVLSTLTFEIQETTIPEPSTYALMGLGLVGISLVARRRAAK